MKITTVGFDFFDLAGKNVFHVHGAHEHGKFALKNQRGRTQLLEFFAEAGVQ